MIQWTAKWPAADSQTHRIVQLFRITDFDTILTDEMHWCSMSLEHINWHHMWWHSQLSSGEGTFLCWLRLRAVISDNTILLTMLSTTECDSEKTAGWFRENRRHFPSRYSRLIMIEGEYPVIQALLGTLLTWALTLAGAAMALFLQVFHDKNL